MTVGTDPPIAPTGTPPAEPARARRHDAAVARGLVCFGLGAALGAVFGMSATVAFDSGRDVDGWYVVAAVAVAVGAVIAALLTRAVVNVGARIGPPLAVVSIVAGAAWIVLFNTGGTTAVDVLVAVGLAASVPMVLLAGLDAVTLDPGVRRLAAVGHPAAATGAGVMVGAAALFVDPTMVWSNVTGVGGLIAVLGAAWRLTLGSGSASTVPADAAVPVPDPVPDPAGASPVGVRVLLAATAGIVAAGLVRIGPYLADGWQAGVRYQLLTWSLAGATAAAVVVGALWVPDPGRRSAARTVDDAGRLIFLAGAAMLVVGASQTLPGTVVGTGAAAGVAAAAVALIAAAGARSETGVGATAATVGVVAAVTWTATWVAWPPLVDALGSDRVVVALVGLPAAVVGAMLWWRPIEAAPAAAAVAPIVVDLTDATDPGGAPDAGMAPSTDGPVGRSGADVLLDARGVEYSYGPVQVLFGVDLQVHRGEVVALLGTNGAGKTTFLRTVAGLAAPSAGSIRLAGGDLSPFSASDRVLLGINQIAADAAVAPDLTVAENLAMFGHTLPRSEARAGASRAVETFPRLGERLGQRASALSGGERQMLSLSKSLVLRPTLLVIDECTLGLAPIAIAVLVPVIRRLHEEGSSVLLVEQSVHLALDLAGRACCMEKGRIVYESGADELRDDPGLLEAVYLEGITAALEERGHGTGPVRR